MNIITNKKRLVTHPFDLAVLKELAEALQKNAKDLLHKDVEFPVVEGGLYPYIENAGNLTFEELTTITKPTHELKMRSFENDETIALPKNQTRTIQHTLTREEKEKMADEICDALEQKEEIEKQKDAAVTAFNKQIKELDAKITLDGKTHKLGVIEKNLEVTVELDFQSGKKIFKDAKSGKEVETVDLDDQDRQLKIDLTGEMFKEDDPSVFGHSRLEEEREKFMGIEGLVIKKGTDQSDFPNLLKIGGDEYGYTSSKDRDADYTLARKLFKGPAKKKEKAVAEPTVERFKGDEKCYSPIKHE